MNTDPLTDIVRSLDLVGGVFLEAEFSAPWAITAHVTEDDCRPFMSVPKQVIAYHVVTEGEALVWVREGEPHRAQAGDVVLLPSNPVHILASAPSLSPVSGDDLLLPQGESGLARIRYGGGGAKSCVLCGFLACKSAPAHGAAPGRAGDVRRAHDDRLVIEVRIPAQEIDRVQIGQTAVLRFPAFDAERTPELPGRVAKLSADAIEAPNAQQPPAYLARIHLPDNAEGLLGEQKLTPGMPAEVYIATDVRTPLSFLLKPVMDHLEKVFRER